MSGGDSDLERLLESVWNYASTKNESSCLYEMTDEMYYLYHIAHMAKHFTAGGCGIKPFIDLWLLENFNNENSLKREELLKKGNLLKFARGVKKTSEIWLGNKEHDVSTQLIENYILNGGTYGICSNAITLNQQKIGSKFKYLLSRIFLPYQSLKRLYPILEKHRWLMPIMQVARWFRTIRNGRFEHSLNEIKHSVSTTDGQRESMKKLLEDLGLQYYFKQLYLKNMQICTLKATVLGGFFA